MMHKFLPLVLLEQEISRPIKEWFLGAPSCLKVCVVKIKMSPFHTQQGQQNHCHETATYN